MFNVLSIIQYKAVFSCFGNISRTLVVDVIVAVYTEQPLHKRVGRGTLMFDQSIYFFLFSRKYHLVILRSNLHFTDTC